MLHDRVFTVTTTADQVQIEAAEPDSYDASLECDPMTLYELFSGDLDLDAARAEDA